MNKESEEVDQNSKVNPFSNPSFLSLSLLKPTPAIILSTHSSMTAALTAANTSKNVLTSLSSPRYSAVDSSSSSSSRRNSSRFSDFPSSISLRSEEYRQLFHLPSDEVLVQDFNCALQENILLQGHMYVFDHYICFYSNIFGYESKKIIPFQDVTSVQRAKTAGIFPNAIEIVAASKKHIFASFLSRDEAFKLILDGWSQNSNGVKALLEQQDSKSETSSQFNGVSSFENGNSDALVSDCDSDERNLEVSSLGGNKSPPNHVDDDVRPATPEVHGIVEEKQDAVFVAGPSTSLQLLVKQETRDGPEIPKGYIRAAESKFPINVEQFYNYFFSDDAVGFVESYHKACGDKDFKCTSWKPHVNFGSTRETSFQHPIKVYFGAKCGGCKETQIYQLYKNSHMVIETSQEVSDVPYADYFTVEGIWDVRKDDNQPEGCLLRVYVSVAFSKRTIWKGKIEQSTMDECRDAYAAWIDLAHKLLKQKNIEKTEGNILEVDQIDQQNTGENGDHTEQSHVNAECEIKSDTPTNTLGNYVPTAHASTVTSATKAFAVKFCSFLKSRVYSQQFLVIMFSVILLLMQLSIVVLLSRPQQVHVIPQANHFTPVGLESNPTAAAEAMAWMDKRVHLLKDEMLAVEGQLERMNHEHAMLLAQLNDLGRITKQQKRPHSDFL